MGTATRTIVIPLFQYLCHVPTSLPAWDMGKGHHSCNGASLDGAQWLCYTPGVQPVSQLTFRFFEIRTGEVTKKLLNAFWHSMVHLKVAGVFPKFLTKRL